MSVDFIFAKKDTSNEVFLSYIKSNNNQPHISDNIAILSNSKSPQHLISMYKTYGIDCTTYITENFVLFDKNTKTLLAFTAPNSNSLYYGLTNSDSLWISTKLLEKNKRKHYKPLPQNTYFLKYQDQDAKVIRVKRIRYSEDTYFKKKQKIN
jgi:hypothetical protein